ncbi:MAG: alkaline phosphatase [Stenomitos rutilans HA7619-LM2]|jgi:alkaline phosphatase|nr:alkaline phosphatase [Stenomitos rutilans HA7619-LM2]
MLRFFSTFSRWLALLAATVFTSSSLLFSPIGLPPALADSGSGNGVNVILMIGDGMGWEMARAASIAKGAPAYKSGKGTGLFMQQLKGYTYATTYGTTIPGANGVYNDGNSALNASDSTCRSTTNPTGIDCGATGAAPPLPGFTFSPEFNPGTPARNLTAAALQPCRTGGSTSGGNLVGYDPAKGGPNPWTPISPAVAEAQGYDRDYITCSYPDSANTATSLYTGVKSYNNAIAVDIFEKLLETILQAANKLGKATGVVTSVPITHATPGAAISSVNRRAKYDADYPALDNILQEAIRSDLPGEPYLPTVLLGGGHPLDFENTAAASTIVPKGFTYIRESTYNELHSKPDSNRYGYKFLERDTRVTDLSVKTKDIVNAGKQLLDVSKDLDPNQGQRLLGLYGARGQNGNIPTRGSTGDYALTGLDNFSVYSSASASTAATGQPANNGTQIPTPDTVRPLVLGETPTNFIQRERKANPTLAQMTKAALNVLSKDKDGFWLMVEGGDVDWAAHDNNMENLIGNVIAFDNAIGEVIQWIEGHGGWRKNVLVVTADHDHYLTINDNFPKLLDRYGAKDLTFAKHTPKTAGHFWGAYDTIKYGWGNHSNRPVPVYYQGAPLNLKQYVGKDFEQYGFTIPGLPKHVDQSQIYQAMLAALKS